MHETGTHIQTLLSKGCRVQPSPGPSLFSIAVQKVPGGPEPPSLDSATQRPFITSEQQPHCAREAPPKGLRRECDPNSHYFQCQTIMAASRELGDFWFTVSWSCQLYSGDNWVLITIEIAKKKSLSRPGCICKGGFCLWGKIRYTNSKMRNSTKFYKFFVTLSLLLSILSRSHASLQKYSLCMGF